MKKALLFILLFPILLASCGGNPPPGQIAPSTSDIIIADKTVNIPAGGTLLDASTSITRINAYDPITFSTSPLPTGITLTFQKNPVTGSDPVVFNVGAPTAALGTYITTIKGVSGGITASAKLTIIVSASPPNGGAAPTDPSYVSAAANSTSVIVNWAAVTSATGYKLDRKVAGGSYSELATLPVTQTTYTDSALTLGTSYGYRVRTVGVQGTTTAGRESPTVTFTGPTTPGNPPPGGPPGCCKVCTGGKPCGDTCIAYNKTCRTPGGCACSASAVVFIRLKDCPNAAKIPVIGLDAAGHEHTLMNFEEWVKLPTSVKLLHLN